MKKAAETLAVLIMLAFAAGMTFWVYLEIWTRIAYGVERYYRVIP